MQSSPAFQTYSSHVKEALEKFYTLYENDDSGRENVENFLNNMNFRIEGVTKEEMLQSLLNKNFHSMFMNERIIMEIFEFWSRLSNASTKKDTTSRLTLTVGTENPEIKKSHINIEVVSDTKKQTALLNQHLASINPDVEVPFFAIKLYTATPNETKDFLDGMLQMVDGLIQSMPIPIIPEISTVAGSDHVVIQVTAKKSLELNFFNMVIGHILGKLPEYDVELRLKMQTGTNWRHLIDNHTDNTVFDILNGYKVSLEFKNNLGGFLDEIANLFSEKNEKKMTAGCRIISFVLGSIQLNADLALNLGANELALMANLPTVNIFDKEGVLSAAPIGQAKSLREDEMGQMILPNLSSLEGRADVFLSTPFFTLHADVDHSGILDLVNSTIDLFSS